MTSMEVLPDATDEAVRVDKNSVESMFKKFMTMPSLAMVRKLLKNPEKFLARTRFDSENMKKLLTVCKSRPAKTTLEDFLKSAAVSEIFQGVRVSKNQKIATKQKQSSAYISDPTTLERASTRSEDELKHKARLFDDIAIFSGSSDPLCSDFLSRASGSL